MPLHIPKRKVSDAENRLRVLCCLNSLGMATLEQLWPFVAQLELMEYMQLCVYVDELKKDGSLAVGTHGIAGCLYLTEEGIRTLSMFERKMPSGDRRRIETEAPIYFAHMSERRQVRAVHEKPIEGLSCVACTVREDDVPTLILRILTKEEALITAAIKQFRVVASHLLTLLYTVALHDVQTTPLSLAKSPDEAFAAAFAGKSMLYAYGKHEHSAVISLKDERATYLIALLMPSLEAAESWASASLGASDQLASRITAMFCAEGEH